MSDNREYVWSSATMPGAKSPISEKKIYKDTVWEPKKEKLWTSWSRSTTTTTS